MSQPFNSVKEHILIPILLVTCTVLFITLFYLCYEYLTVYTNSETVEYYLFGNQGGREQYLASTLFGILICFLLLTLSALSIKWKKHWLFLVLIFFNFSQLTYLLFF